MTAHLSRERLEALANLQSLECMALPASHAESAEMARMLLAGMSSEPVAFIAHYESGLMAGVCDVDDTVKMEWLKRGLKVSPLYAAPPPPAPVPVTKKSNTDYFDTLALDTAREIMCDVHRRADFLGGDIQLLSRIQCRIDEALRAAMLKAGPVTAATVPDGWKLVPVEPTAEMISSGITAHYERSQIQIHDRPAPGPMECGYVAMLAASPSAPEQEV